MPAAPAYLGFFMQVQKSFARCQQRSIRHAKVGQDDRSHVQQVIVVLSHKGLIVANALLKLLLHEEDVGHVPQLR